MIEIALFQPDIAPNAASILRLAACLGLRAGIIEPAGFTWSDSAFRRAGMDYLDQVDVTRYRNWGDFVGSRTNQRVILVTTKGNQSYFDFSFQRGDILLMGRESAGVPDYVHAHASARLRIPMMPKIRSLNVAVACGIVASEALRQLGGFPEITE